MMDILGAIKNFFTLPEIEQPTTELAPVATTETAEPVTLEEVVLTATVEPAPAPKEETITWTVTTEDEPPREELGFFERLLSPDPEPTQEHPYTAIDIPTPHPPAPAEDLVLDASTVDTMPEEELIRLSKLHPFYAYHLGQRWQREGKC